MTNHESSLNILQRFEQFRVKWQRWIHRGSLGIAFVLYLLKNLGISFPEPFNASFIGLLILYVLAKLRLKPTSDTALV
jgi:hypothetical protein